MVQIPSQLTKKGHEWIYSYQSRILLLSLNTIYSLLLFFFRWFSVFICMLLERPPMISRNMCLSWRPCPQLSFCYKWQAKTRDKVTLGTRLLNMFEIWTQSTEIFMFLHFKKPIKLICKKVYQFFFSENVTEVC